MIVAEGLPPPESLYIGCEASQTRSSPPQALLGGDRPPAHLPSRRLADTVSMHGVFMDVLGMGC